MSVMNNAGSRSETSGRELGDGDVLLACVGGQEARGETKTSWRVMGKAWVGWVFRGEVLAWLGSCVCCGA